MEKQYLDRRLTQMEAEGTRFRVGVNVGVDIPATRLKDDFEALILACGATAFRDLPIPGRELSGVHQAMEYLPLANRVQEGDLEKSPISAEGKHVVIIGGGDTGADCLGTAHRQGAVSVRQLEIMPRPPEERPDTNPWPTWPMIYRVSSAHEEGGERDYAVNTEEFIGDEKGCLEALTTVRVEQSVRDGRVSFDPLPGTEQTIRADLVLLALGFVGTERSALIEQLGIQMDARGNVAKDQNWATNVPDVYVCGDMGRGQSLIVWAIAEGRACAAAVDKALTGVTDLPAVVTPFSTALT